MREREREREKEGEREMNSCRLNLFFADYFADLILKLDIRISSNLYLILN